MHGTLRWTRSFGVLRRLVDSFKEEARKDQKFQEKVQELNAQISKIKRNPTVERTANAYDCSRRVLKSANERLKKSSLQSYQYISDTAKTAGRFMFPKVKRKRLQSQPARSEFTKKVSENLSEARERLSEITDASVYGGVLSKEARMRRKQRLEAEFKRQKEIEESQRVEEDPNAGVQVQVHKDSLWRAKWNDLVDSTPLFKGIFKSLSRSDNLLAHYSRELFDALKSRLSGIFKESEMAQVLKEIQRREKNFNLEGFIAHLRSFIVPEVLEADLVGDLETLRLWSTDGLFNVHKARLNTEKTSQKFLKECKVLDIRSVELMTAKMINDEPVLVVSFNAQQMTRLVEKKTDLIEEEQIVTLGHVWALTKTDCVGDAVTGGWRIIEMATRPLW